MNNKLAPKDKTHKTSKNKSINYTISIMQLNPSIARLEFGDTSPPTKTKQ